MLVIAKPIKKSASNTTSYKDRLSEHIDAYLSLVTSHPKVRLSEFESLVEYSHKTDGAGVSVWCKPSYLRALDFPPIN